VTFKKLHVSLSFAAGKRAASVSSKSFLEAVADAARPLAVGVVRPVWSVEASGSPITRRDLSMSLEARIKELSERHKRLEAAIAAEMKHPAGDDVRIHELKRKKLRIKDEIASLRTN
jgi:hypothetical protein